MFASFKFSALKIKFSDYLKSSECLVFQFSVSDFIQLNLDKLNMFCWCEWGINLYNSDYFCRSPLNVPGVQSSHVLSQVQQHQSVKQNINTGVFVLFFHLYRRNQKNQMLTTFSTWNTNVFRYYRRLHKIPVKVPILVVLPKIARVVEVFTSTLCKVWKQ